MPWIIAVLPFFITVLLYLRSKSSKDDVSTLRGPPSTSWLYGNLLDVLQRVPYGEAEGQWQRMYGRAYRIRACFGENRLVITDSAALRYITANSSMFIRPPPFQVLMELAFGKGSVIATAGDNHHRVREIMNPAFSAQNIRNLTPTLSKVAGDLVDRLLSQCENQGSACVVDIFRYLHDTSLQAVGEAIMGYRFTDDDGFKKCYENLSIATAKRTQSAILMDAIIPYLPRWVQMLEQRRIAESISDKMVRNKLEIQRLGLPPDKDLYSTLVDINSKAAVKMSFQELKEQFGSLNSAGEDTTANTLCWSLFELAKNVKWQEELREEVIQSQLKSGRIDYDKLPFLNSLIKEVLRFYTPGPNTSRMATQDTVIPLATPVTTTTGKTINEVSVKKGQLVHISIHSYHRLTESWGPDANEFRPSRWLDGKSQLGDGAAIGPYSSMLVFWGGAYTCLG
ncbi:cytochrome P450 [Cyathus striatus]|nr:cytochrome P450 [Cyathus striatus]